MTTAHNTRGYSEFFASGIRVVSRRLASPRFDPSSSSTRTPAIIPLTLDTIDSDSESTPKRRPRPNSMLIALPNSAIAHAKRQRRSSLASISSRLFGRKPQTISNDESGWVSSTAHTSTSSLQDPSEFWDMGTSPHSLFPSCPNGGVEHLEPLDPFSPSPSSKSFFVDLHESPKTSCSLSSISSVASSSCSSSFFSRKRDSFLHITSTPPPDASFLHFPRIRHSKGCDSSPRERPVSVHNTPNVSMSTGFSVKHANTTTATTATTTTTTTTTATTTSATTTAAAATATSTATTIATELSSTTTSVQSQPNDILAPPTRSRGSSPAFLCRTSSISVTIPLTVEQDNVTSSAPVVVTEPIMAEEEAPVSATDARIFFSNEDDVPARMDWRQFHIDMLTVHHDA